MRVPWQIYIYRYTVLRYQIILLPDRSTGVWTTCSKLLRSSTLMGGRIPDIPVPALTLLATAVSATMPPALLWLLQWFWRRIWIIVDFILTTIKVYGPNFHPRVILLFISDSILSQQFFQSEEISYRLALAGLWLRMTATVKYGVRT